MTDGPMSHFAQPAPGLRIKEGAPAPMRPSREEMEAFPEEARQLVRSFWQAQEQIIKGTPTGKTGTPASSLYAPCECVRQYDLEWVRGKHFVIAGGTGQGLGGALSVALLHLLKEAGSLTVISRDLTRSLGYEAGAHMQALAHEMGYGNRFHWLNSGLAVEGRDLEIILAALHKAGAESVVYINTIAAASSGMLPGHPPVYVMDLDEEGAFQWKLTELDQRQIDSTKFFMGTMAAEFPGVLDRHGVGVALTAFADWRGSLDRESRDPASPTYGRQGPYSTSLYLPKEIIREATSQAYGTGQLVLDFFLPVMQTRALGFIPGGRAMSMLYASLMRREGIRRIEVPELAVAMIDRMGKALSGEEQNPYPRLDAHEAQVDLWFYELIWRLNNDEKSEFYYRKWIDMKTD